MSLHLKKLPIAPSNLVIDENDLNRALETLNLVFQDQDWGEGETKFRQNTIVELMRTRGVPRMLTLAIIEDLMARGVLREGESFVDLRIFVALSGRQTDEAMPNRYLHTTYAKWLSFIASRKKDERVASSPRAVPTKKGQVPFRSWTQSELDMAIREYKAKRASSYRDMVEGVKQGKPGARKSARKVFGRNAIARALGVKARAMVSRSKPWQEIAQELSLSWCRTRIRLARSKRVGQEAALEQKSEECGDTTQDAVFRREVINLARQRLPMSEADALIEKLEKGEATAEGAHQVIELYQDQQKDAKQRKIHPTP